MKTKSRLRRRFAVVLLALSTQTILFAQSSTNDPTSTLKQLLELPAPPPSSARFNGKAKTEIVEKGRPSSFYDENNPPKDDAPVEDLVDYWDGRTNFDSTLITDNVRQRLFEVFIQDPAEHRGLLGFMPTSEIALTQIKDIYDRALRDTQIEDVAQAIKQWLFYRSKYFIDEVANQANKARDHQEYASVREGPELTALASLDWDRAEPLLLSLKNNNTHKRTAVLALTLLYKHARDQKEASNEDKYGSELRTIASDRALPGHARNAAIEALSSSPWSGRDEWYLGLFNDESLTYLIDAHSLYQPLRELAAANGDKWAPILIRLTESKDKVIRSNAVNCLMVIPAGKTVEALKALLPWLSDPDWAEDRINRRLELIHAISQVDLPESVPGLIWMVEHESDYRRSYAADALVKYKDIRAIPALRKALLNETDGQHRGRIINGLLAVKAISESEQLAALEAFAEKVVETPELAVYFPDKKFPIEVSLGFHLSKAEDISASVLQLVLARAEALQKSSPLVAQALLTIAHQWKGRQIDLDILNRIANGTIDPATIAKVLDSRVEFRESVGAEIQSLTSGKGFGSGLAAVLLDDAGLAQSVLASENEAARIMLLAAARLTEMSLPISDIESLLRNKNELLASAAESFLLRDDTVEAREALWKNRPDRAFITGWREDSGLMNRLDDVAFEKQEEQLRKELLNNKSLRAVVGLISESESHKSVVRVYENRITYTVSMDRSRYMERELSKAELTTLKETLETAGVLEWGPQINDCHHNCFVNEFVSLTRDKGRRVFAQSGTGKTISRLFEQLTRTGNFSTRYNFENEIPGLEILYSAGSPGILDAARENSVLKVLVQREQTAEEVKQQQETLNADDDSDDYQAAQLKYHRLRVELEAARLSWRTFDKGVVGEATQRPKSHPPPPPDLAVPDLSRPEDFVSSRLNAPDNVVVYVTESQIVKAVKGLPVTPLAEGRYGIPVVTSDGKWVVAAKTDSDGGSAPIYLVRINLDTGKEFRLDIEPADELLPILFVPFRNRVLAKRAKNDFRLDETNQVGPDSPEYYLIDPVTGKALLAKGEFDPLEQVKNRFLQKTSKAEEYWAAIPDRDKNETRIGLYSVKDFSFRAIQTIPKIEFDSMNMWVDEAAGKIYVVYNNQLLRLPLKSAQADTITSPQRR